MRYDRLKRQHFSVVTSVLVVSISAFITSDQTNVYQMKKRKKDVEFHETENKDRRKLSATISMANLPFFFLSNLILYFLLAYKKDFITPTLKSNLIMEKENTEQILRLFLLPLGGCLMVSNLMYYKVMNPLKNPFKNYYGTNYIYKDVSEKVKAYVQYCVQGLLALVVFLCVVILASFSSYHIGKGEGGRHRR